MRPDLTGGCIPSPPRFLWEPTQPAGLGESMPRQQATPFLTIDLARLFRQRMEAAMAEGGIELTAGEARALTFIARHPGTRQTQLCALMGLEPMTLVAFLDRLESRGLVRRVPDFSDRRAKQVEPTEAAAAMVQAIDTICDAIRGEATSGMTPAEVDALDAGLRHAHGRLTPVES